VPVGTPVDCSGLVDQVYGITGTTYTQVYLGTAVASLSQAQPGDLVFFGPALAPNEAYHVGIYTGNGMMIDAPHTGTVVQIDAVSGFGSIAAIRRLVASDSQTGDLGGGQYNYAQLEAVWIQAGGSAQTAAMAAAISMAESNGNSGACGTNTNGSVDRGLWQINSTNGSQSSFDVMTNARAAVAISNNGTNWRPWCTAYSDGACGTKGGVYQGPGSPYLKFLQTGVAPDYSAPINATNAAANQPGTPTADLTSFSVGSILDCVSNPGLCIAGQTASAGNVLIAGTIKAIMHSILNPIIQPIAGAMGIAAGGVLFISGLYVMVSQTKAGQQATSGLFTAGALAAGQPELAAGGLKGVGRAQSFQRRENFRQSGIRQTGSVRSAQRIQEMNIEQQLNLEAAAYREWLRRTRPVPSPRPRPGSAGPTAIPANSRRTR
jgi:hypothetical protein